MKLYQVIKKGIIDDTLLFENLEKNENSDYAPAYKMLLKKLRNEYIPYVNKIIINVKKDVNGFNVYGTLTYPDTGKNLKKIPLDIICWQKWLGMEVNDLDVNKYGINNVIEQILYEMTSLSFEDNIIYSKEDALKVIDLLSFNELDHYNLNKEKIDEMIAYIKSK